jgi:hypothetical protein
MRLSPASEASDAALVNAVPGKVRDIVYTGSDIQYFVELGAAMIVVVRVPNDRTPRIGSLPMREDSVRVSWEVESTGVLLA